MKNSATHKIKQSLSALAILSLAVLCSGCGTTSNYGSYDDASFDRTDELEQENSALQDQLDEANQRTDEANQRIDDAKSNAWDDYDTMGESLDDLETVDY